MKVVAIVQARVGSTRFPGKVLAELCGKTLLDVLIARLQHSTRVNQILVATSVSHADELLVQLLKANGISVFCGSERDVLQRYADAARFVDADVVIRITGDCPIVDPRLVDQAVDCLIDGRVDYVTNADPPSFPDGFDVEVFTSDALYRAESRAELAEDREHVTPYFRHSGEFRCLSIRSDRDHSHLRLTVDEPVDLDVVRKVFAYFAPSIDFSLNDVLTLHNMKPELFLENSAIRRNEGGCLGTGQKLWKRASRVIPGGNMLLSKRAEMFLPEYWPAYFERASGCTVWDLDGRELIDMSLMGVGTNSLGYGHPEVDRAVMDVVSKGNMSTLNCPEEVTLAEHLVELHPWADMVRLARTGGEANAISVRIGRAASGRDGVAVCGYHGWHDWYLSANLPGVDGLAEHLLPGLNPAGVPKHLSGTVFPFSYGDFEGLSSIVRSQSIGVIKMEVCRNTEPNVDFLLKVRKLADDSGIVLIFDECTSGFRQSYGGLHLTAGVSPDIAIFGKALGNGYAISAVIGRRSVMEAAQSTFISSTFWTERIGPAAAVKTLEVMQREKSWVRITEIGNTIKCRWQKLADQYGLQISHWGIAALAGFSFESSQRLAHKTYLTQEMLKAGFLASNSVYSCLSHSESIIDRYFEALDPIFLTIGNFENGRGDAPHLDGLICHDGFKRLN